MFCLWNIFWITKGKMWICLEIQNMIISTEILPFSNGIHQGGWFWHILFDCDFKWKDTSPTAMNISVNVMSSSACLLCLSRQTIAIMSVLILMAWSVFLMNLVGCGIISQRAHFINGRSEISILQRTPVQKSSCTYTVPHYWYSKMYFVELYCTLNLFFYFLHQRQEISLF